MPTTLHSTHHNQSPEAQFESGLLSSNWLVNNGLKLGVDLLFPPRCAGCGRVDTRWCMQCQQEIDAIDFPASSTPFDAPALTMIAATGQHEGILQRAVWALKFENERHIAGILGTRLSRRLQALDWPIDMIIPVPLHTKRLNERGYNQSQLIGEHLANIQERPLFPEAIIRTLETHTQVGLNAQQRKENMKGAFVADETLVNGKTVLLIDDVYTTGATLNACAEAALTAGAVKVYGMTVTMA